MGLDSECDLAISAGDNDRVSRAIEALRNRLLIEHLGTSIEMVSSTFQNTKSLIDTIRSLSQHNSSRRLVNLDISEEYAVDTTNFFLEEDLLDPEKPYKMDHILDHFTYEEDSRSDRVQLIKIVAVLIVLLGLAAAWRWTPLFDLVDIDTITAFSYLLKNDLLTSVGVVFAYILTGLLMVPVTILIGATGIIFSPLLGTLYALMGCLASAITAYGIGTKLGHNMIRRLSGKRLNRISKYLAKKGILTIAIVRNIPIVPFTIINLLAGASHIKLSDFLIGTAIGMLPGILAINIFSNRLMSVIKNPSPGNIALATGIAVFMGLGIWFANRRLSRNKSMPEHDHSG